MPSTSQIFLRVAAAGRTHDPRSDCLISVSTQVAGAADGHKLQPHSRSPYKNFTAAIRAVKCQKVVSVCHCPQVRLGLS